jgi:ribulose-phosphate 3-epimerase
MMVHLAPSILSADFARLGEQVLETERAGANRVHIDVMDGHFVPNLSMGAIVVKALRPITRLPLEVHLMIEEPDRFVPDFLRKGADTIIFHQEVVPQPQPLIQLVRSLGKRVGMAVNPETPVDALAPHLPQLDLALCMTVHPGFGGQAFLPESPERISRLRGLIEQLNPACELEVDGGIDRQTVPVAVKAGANVLVAGTAIFGMAEGASAAVKQLLADVSRLN